MSQRMHLYRRALRPILQDFCLGLMIAAGIVLICLADSGQEATLLGLLQTVTLAAELAAVPELAGTVLSFAGMLAFGLWSWRHLAQHWVFRATSRHALTTI